MRKICVMLDGKTKVLYFPKNFDRLIWQELPEEMCGKCYFCREWKENIVCRGVYNKDKFKHYPLCKDCLPYVFRNINHRR